MGTLVTCTFPGIQASNLSWDHFGRVYNCILSVGITGARQSPSNGRVKNSCACARGTVVYTLCTAPCKICVVQAAAWPLNRSGSVAVTLAPFSQIAGVLLSNCLYVRSSSSPHPSARAWLYLAPQRSRLSTIKMMMLLGTMRTRETTTCVQEVR